MSSETLESKSESMSENVINVREVKEETTTPKSKEDAKLKFKAKHQSKLKGLNKEASVNPQEGEMTMAELLAKRKALEEAKKNNNESEIKCND